MGFLALLLSPLSCLFPSKYVYISDQKDKRKGLQIITIGQILTTFSNICISHPQSSKNAIIITLQKHSRNTQRDNSKPVKTLAPLQQAIQKFIQLVPVKSESCKPLFKNFLNVPANFIIQESLLTHQSSFWTTTASIHTLYSAQDHNNIRGNVQNKFQLLRDSQQLQIAQSSYIKRKRFSRQIEYFCSILTHDLCATQMDKDEEFRLASLQQRFQYYLKYSKPRSFFDCLKPLDQYKLLPQFRYFDIFLKKIFVQNASSKEVAQNVIKNHRTVLTQYFGFEQLCVQFVHQIVHLISIFYQESTITTHHGSIGC